MQAPNTGVGRKLYLSEHIRPYFPRAVWDELLKKNPKLAKKIVDNSESEWTILGVYRKGCPPELIEQAYESLG